MKFGLFGSAQAQRGGPDLDSGQGFRDYIEYNVEAEALGYNSTFVVEHHFTGFGQVSASLNLLTWVAARTKTLRLGTAVMVLPWHNPVLLAEQAATIDLLSGGRLEFGVGKGYRHNEFASFCIPMEEADERFEEGLALIIKSWTSRRSASRITASTGTSRTSSSSRRRRRSRIRRSGWRPAVRIRSARWRGAAPSCCSTSLPRPQLDDRALQHLQDRGREPAAGNSIRWMSRVSRAFFVAKNAEDKAKAIEARLANQRGWQSLRRRRRATSKSSMLSFDQTLDAAAESAMFGTPDEIAAKLSTLRAAGVEHVLLNGPAGSRENLRAFARDVMPAFAGSAPSGDAAAAAARERPSA